MVSLEERIIALIDMDCFYVQVEQRDQPDLWGKPVAVIQFNQGRPGGLIAVSYEARALGVKRGMRAAEAKEQCPSINLVQVPHQRGKTDLTKYRRASSQVFAAINSFHPDIVVERASVDEAYLDLTKLVQQQIRDVGAEKPVTEHDLPGTHIITNYGNDLEREELVKQWIDTSCLTDFEQFGLALGAKIVEKIRVLILEQTEFHCSAGIGHTKTLAKVVCAKHKPKQQTVITTDGISDLFLETPIQTVRNLGGKLGARLVEKLDVKVDYSSQSQNVAEIGLMSTIPATNCELTTTMADVYGLSRSALEEEFGQKTAGWLYNLARGKDPEEVKARDLNKSLGAGKNFYGKNALKTRAEVKEWIGILCQELSERLIYDRDTNVRTATTLVCGLKSSQNEQYRSGSTRQTKISSYAAEDLSRTVLNLLNEFNKEGRQSEKWHPPVFNLSMAAGRFEDGMPVVSRAITDFYTSDKNKPALELELPPDPDSPKAGPSHQEPAEDDNVSLCGSDDLFADTEEQPVDPEVPPRSPEPEHHSPPPIIEGDYLPNDISQIDEELYKTLPLGIQFELRGYYRTKNGTSRPPSQNTSSAPTPAATPKNKKKASKAGKKRSAAKKKEEPEVKCYKINQFFEHA